ncbi:MAG TPA: AAA family ATPase [Terriglobales bacterium]|nr:AAA family ATPase [Terriglobales bacterium]
MYTEFYGMTERPFNVTPDPKFLYLNARYREAIASLHYGITQRKGFITLIGEAGTGKTTLLKRLLEDLDPKTKSVFIFNTNVTFEEILEYIFAEFDLAVHNGKKLYMLQRLNTFLLEELRNGGNVALLIDEAQDLDFSVLEDLRLLSNLETAKEKILQIVLSGQPELGQKLSNPALRQLRQRITINCRLLPLSRDEITEYLQFRLQAGGCPDLKLFSREAEDRVYHFSRGVPRLVNVVCDNALVIGYALGKKRIGADIIDEAAADLMPVELFDAEMTTPERTTTVGPLPAPAAPVSPERWRQRLLVAGLVVLGIVVTVLSIGAPGLRNRGDDSTRAETRMEVINPGSDGENRAAAAQPPPEPPVKVADPAEIRDPRQDLERPAANDVDSKRADGSHGLAANEPAAPAAAPQVVANADPIAPPAASQPLEDSAQQDRRAAPPRQIAPESAPSAREAAVAAREAAVAAREAASAAREELPEPRPVAPAREAAPLARQVEPTRPARVEAAKPEPAQVAKAEPPADQDPARPEDLLPEVTNDRETAAAEVSPRGNGARLDGIEFAPVTVRPGDSVSQIAIQKYGQASPVILDLLKLSNPNLDDIDRIHVGQTIRLPQLSEGFPILNDGSGRYSLLVYSTREGWRAQALRNALRGKGFDAVVSSGSLGRGKPMTRVIVQGNDRDAIVAAGQKLQRLIREDSSIAQLSQ